MSRFDAIVERLHALHPRLIDLSLGRLQRLLGQLDHPECRLPPVIHVAGTNGKGSTTAFLRAIAEASGRRAHVYTSPHLVRLNERFRVAGELVSDETLAATLAEIEAVNAGAEITVFEVLTAASFVLFARHPAEICLLEVGLGGRYDATNVIPTPAASAITSISIDHQDFLGDTLAQIAGEKAGIIKPGAPAITGRQAPEAAAVLEAAAMECGTSLHVLGRDFHAEAQGEGMCFTDSQGTLILPAPGLIGAHQVENAAIAIAALRQSGLDVPDAAYGGIAHAEWPARMQRLHHLAAELPAGWELWLDGGHNPGAGLVLAEQARRWADRPLHLVVGMKQSKDAAEFLRPLLPLVTSITAVSEPGQHLALPVEAIIAASGGVARPGPTVAAALAGLPRGGTPARVLICGSLYLAGVVLEAEDEK